MIVDAFRDSIYPYMVQLAVVFFVFALCQFAYALFRRPDWQQFLDKFKGAVFGYAVVRGAFAILLVIDNIIDNMYK